MGVTRYGGIHINNDNTSPTDGAAWDSDRWQISERDTNQFDIAHGTPTNTNVGTSNTLLRILSSGNVGINLGATDPSTNLHVSGTIRQTSVTSNVLVANANGELVAATNLTDVTYLQPGQAEIDPYTPLNPANWVGAPPADIREAMNRMESLLVALSGAPIP